MEDETSCLDHCVCTNSGEMLKEEIDQMYGDPKDEEEEECSGSESL